MPKKRKNRNFIFKTISKNKSHLFRHLSVFVLTFILLSSLLFISVFVILNNSYNVSASSIYLDDYNKTLEEAPKNPIARPFFILGKVISPAGFSSKESAKESVKENKENVFDKTINFFSSLFKSEKNETEFDSESSSLKTEAANQQEQFVNDKDWITFEKDNINSKIADYNLSLPLRLKWMYDIQNDSYGGGSIIYTYLLSKDGLLVAINGATGSGTLGYISSAYRTVFNSSTGEKLWSDGHSGEFGGYFSYLKDDALIKEFITGTDSHHIQYGNELETGLESQTLSSYSQTNYDPISSILVTTGWPFVDSIDHCYFARDISNFSIALTNINGKFNGAYEFHKIRTIKNSKIGFEYIDLGKREKPYKRDDLISELNPGSQNWTVMLWFKWDGILKSSLSYNNNDYEYLFAKESLYGARLLNGTVRYGFDLRKINSNFYGNDSFYCPPNEWCHLAVTYDHQKEKLYKDGQLVFERNNTLDIESNNNSLYIGGLPGNLGVGFGGLIDEFAVFNRSLTENEVNNIYDEEIIPDGNTILLLHFNNDSNFLENESFIHDFSGNNFNGKPVGHHYATELWKDCGDKYTGLTAFPLIQKGIIYGTRGKLYAYNETTGGILWEKGVDKDYLNNLTTGELIFADNVIGSESLAYLDGVVFAYGREFYNNSFLDTCDVPGQKQEGCSMHDIIKNYTKPVIVGFNATNGSEVLRIDFVNKLNISNFSNNTLLFDIIVNGNILYVRIGNYSPAFGYDTILSSKYEYIRSNKLAAIDLSNENLLWVVDFLYDPTLLVIRSRSASPIQHLVLSGNTLFVTLNDSVVGINKYTGEKVWQFDNPYSDSLRFSGLIIDDNTLFLGYGDGRIFAFEPGYDTPDIFNIETSLPVSQINNSYSYAIAVMNGEGPFNWQIISGSLPNGLNLVNDPNSTKGIINGTPTSAGDYNFTVRVTDKRGNFDEEQFYLRISSASGVVSRDLKNGFDNYSGCIDSYIFGSGINKNKNFGKKNDTLVFEKPYFYRGLMKFNIFEREGGLIPDDAVIVKATLTLYKQDDIIHNDISFYQLLKDWKELEVTWNQARNGVNWSEAGANETDSDRTEKLGNFSVSSAKAFYTVDITPALEGYDRGVENNGLLLSKSRGDIFNFSSCDYINQTTGDISLRPKLTVYYKRTLIPTDNKPPEVELYMNPSIVLNGSTHTIYANIKDDYSINGYSLKILKILNEYYSVNVDLNLSCIPNPNNKNLLCETNKTFLPFIYYFYFVYYSANLELIAIDEYGVNSSISIPISVVPPFNRTTITTLVLRKGNVNQAYSDRIFAEGGSGYQWSIISGSLPSGLVINSATGEISGTPTLVGNYNFTVRVNGGSTSDSKSLSINIINESAELTICNSNTDCGSDTFTGFICGNGNSINRTYINYTCINPGTENSRCVSATSSYFYQNCSSGQTCSNGACVNVACSLNSQCGTNFNSSNYCSENQVRVNATTFTCNNPGTSGSTCINTTNSLLIQTCPNDVNSSNFCRTANLSVVYYNSTDWGCSSGSCSSSLITNQIKQVCSSNQTCSNGACVPVTCSSNSSCGTNRFIGNRFCNLGNLYQNFTNYNCINPGLPNSSCNVTITSLLNQTCLNDFNSTNYCMNGNVVFDLYDFSCPTGQGSCNDTITVRLNETCANGCLNAQCISLSCVDSDEDGIIDYNLTHCPEGRDQCIESGMNFNPMINSNLIPNSTKFNFTNPLNYNDLRRIKNFNLNFFDRERIAFRENISLINLNKSNCFQIYRINLDLVFDVNDTRIVVNSTDYRIFNKSAVIYFYGDFTNPKILRDGADCDLTVCKIINNSNNKITVNVTSFSTYDIVENAIVDIGDVGDDNNQGSGGGGGRGSTVNVETARTNNSLNNTVSPNIETTEEKTDSVQDETATEEPTENDYKSIKTFLISIIVILIIVGFIIMWRILKPKWDEKIEKGVN